MSLLGVKERLLDAITRELEPDCVDRRQAISLAKKVIGVVCGFVEWTQAQMKLAEEQAVITNTFPEGQIAPDDAGPLGMLLSHTEDHVRIDFQKQIRWFSMNKDQAIQFGLLIFQHCGVPVQVNIAPAPAGGSDPV